MKRDKAPPTSPVIDERNLARLGVVSIQTRLTTTHDRWKHTFSVAGRRVEIEGNAPEGRPRGIDTNVLLGIETLFHAQGSPEDNWLHTTAYELREASFLANNGQNYSRLRESINRLFAVYFKVAQGWEGNPLRHNESVRIIDRMRYWDIGETDSIRELVPNATLSLKLADQVATSIRSGFTQALERKMLADLSQPPARALYRVLEAYRYTETGQQLSELTSPLEEWRKACGIPEGMPNKVMRALQEAHSELMAQGYLRDVTLTGPRRAPDLTYHFSDHDDPDPALVRLLIERRVSSAMAHKLAKNHAERVEGAIAFVDYRKTQPTGVRDEAALLVKVIQNYDTYVMPPALNHDPETRAAAEGARQRTRAEQLEAEHAAQGRLEAERRVATTPEAQWQLAGRALKTLLRRHLSGEQLARLEQRCLSGEILAGELQAQAIDATLTLRMQTFVEDLQLRLNAEATTAT